MWTGFASFRLAHGGRLRPPQCSAAFFATRGSLRAFGGTWGRGHREEAQEVRVGCGSSFDAIPLFQLRVRGTELDRTSEQGVDVEACFHAAVWVLSVDQRLRSGASLDILFVTLLAVNPAFHATGGLSPQGYPKLYRINFALSCDQILLSRVIRR